MVGNAGAWMGENSRCEETTEWQVHCGGREPITERLFPSRLNSIIRMGTIGILDTHEGNSIINKKQAFLVALQKRIGWKINTQCNSNGTATNAAGPDREKTKEYTKNHSLNVQQMHKLIQFMLVYIVRPSEI